jgi:hypothetical protein
VPPKSRLCPGEHDCEQYRHAGHWTGFPKHKHATSMPKILTKQSETSTTPTQSRNPRDTVSYDRLESKREMTLRINRSRALCCYGVGGHGVSLVRASRSCHEKPQVTDGDGTNTPL